jgi:hypothetical protein
MTTSDEIIGGPTNPAAARVQRIAAPIASPGCCIMCGKNEHPDGFADPRLDFEFYGTFYLCGDCVGDFARLFGWINPDQAVTLALKVKELSDELAIHREALLNLESGLEQITNYRMLRNTIPDSSDGSSLDFATAESAEETDATASGRLIKLPSATSASESDVSESVTEQGPDDVPEPTNDEPPSDESLQSSNSDVIEDYVSTGTDAAEFRMWQQLNGKLNEGGDLGDLSDDDLDNAGWVPTGD